MATQITSYKVFIASPGGLEKERSAFKSVVVAHNQADALSRACSFEPVGWEITLGGVGRPQEKINMELRECDLFVLLLWDRWGSPTGAQEGYTSGTEEEYRIALDCLKDQKYPMRDIVVLFKAVDPRQLSDPGPQLSAVLAFKKELEKSKLLLFETFDTTDSFSDKLRRHLAKWTRDHESGVTKSGTTGIVIARRSRATIDPKLSDFGGTISNSEDARFIEKIEKIYKQGNLTESEAQLVKDIVIRRNLQAFYSYGLFLIKAERQADALVVFEEMHKLALAVDEISWAGTAIARIAGIFRAQGRYKESQLALERAIKLKQESGDEKGELSALIWMGDLLLQLKRPANALDSFEKALNLAKTLASEKTLADTYFKAAKCLMNIGRIDEALVRAQSASDLYTTLNDKVGITGIKHWRKSKKAVIG